MRPNGGERSYTECFFFFFFFTPSENVGTWWAFLSNRSRESWDLAPACSPPVRRCSCAIQSADPASVRWPSHDLLSCPVRQYSKYPVHRYLEIFQLIVEISVLHRYHTRPLCDRFDEYCWLGFCWDLRVFSLTRCVAVKVPPDHLLFLQCPWSWTIHILLGNSQVRKLVIRKCQGFGGSKGFLKVNFGFAKFPTRYEWSNIRGPVQ